MHSNPESLSFLATENMNLIRDSARAFAENEIKPHVMKFDEAQEFPSEIFRNMASLGFFGVMIPTES